MAGGKDGPPPDPEPYPPPEQHPCPDCNTWVRRNEQGTFDCLVCGIEF